MIYLKGKKMKDKIKKELLLLQDQKYQAFHQNLCPGINNIIGIRIPVLRNFAKKLIHDNDVALLINEIDNEYYEEIMLQGLLIGFEKNFTLVKKMIIDFVPKIDNWAVCDTFCASLKITNKNLEKMWEIINYYLNSKNEFELRFAIVMILDYYIKEEYLETIFKVFNQIESNKYYVQMALAWALSICLIKYYNQTLEYLKKCNLDKFTFNKAIQKAFESYRITNIQKEELKKYRR